MAHLIEGIKWFSVIEKLIKTGIRAREREKMRMRMLLEYFLCGSYNFIKILLVISVIKIVPIRNIKHIFVSLDFIITVYT